MREREPFLGARARTQIQGSRESATPHTISTKACQMLRNRSAQFFILTAELTSENIFFFLRNHSVPRDSCMTFHAQAHTAPLAFHALHDSQSTSFGRAGTQFTCFTGDKIQILTLTFLHSSVKLHCEGSCGGTIGGGGGWGVTLCGGVLG